MSEIFRGKKVLITGGAGSVGRALIDEILKQEPEVIRIFDSSENGIFHLEQEYGKKKLRYLIGSVRDKNRLKRAMEGIDIVLHLAAMKHVIACEYNPFEAVRTNIEGTQNIIDTAMEENVEKVIFSSSDKAVNPANVMGTTKLLAEKMITTANYYTGPNRRTIFASVRFGNVMGSSGSVIPIFKNQIENNEFITITDENMTRFVLTMDDAVNLITKSTELAKGGEIFVMKMKTMRITDLANAMINKFGNGKEVEIKSIGAKTGEKPYEEVLTEEELQRTIEADGMYIILPQMGEIYLDPYEHTGASKVENAVLKSTEGEQMHVSEIENFLSEVMK